MRSNTTTALAFALLLATAPALAQHFGAPMPAGEALPVAQALAQAEALEGQTVKLQGRIIEVCQRTGCWVVLDAGGTPVRVRTEHVFFVPKDASGQALVHGIWRAAPKPADAPADAAPQWQVIASAITILP